MTDTTNTDLGTELLADVKQAAADTVITALKIYSGIILAALNNLAQTPSVSQLGAEALSIEGNIIAAFPSLEQAEIQVLAADVKTAFIQLQTYVTTQAQTLQTATPAAVVTPPASS